MEKDKVAMAMYIVIFAFDFDFGIDTNTSLDYFENLDSKIIILGIDTDYKDSLAFAYKPKKTVDY